VPLRDIDLDLPARALPAAVAELLGDADSRIDAFIEALKDDPLPAFVPSDYALVYAALEAILSRGLAGGRSLCEWGSGFGVIAMIASTLGYDACGIEIEPRLVDCARSLAEDHRIEASFACGTFLPVGAERWLEELGESTWIVTGRGDDAYDELGLDLDDFDVIFAYPWPGEEGAMDVLFERYAAAGALLVTYHGIDQIRVKRKVRGKVRRVGTRR
jgi:hypothetical protein